jgi:serine protease Do
MRVLPVRANVARAAAVLGALLWVCLDTQDVSHLAYAGGGDPAQATADDRAELQAQLPELSAVSRAFKLVARIARPGVVYIHVSGGKQPAGASQWERDRLRNELKDQGLSPEDIDSLVRRTPPASASGFIIDRDGYILTNNHVVEGRDEMSVVLYDEHEYPATLVGRDPKTDLAVIKIDAPDLQPLKFGNSDDLEVGDWVLAVGAPFGLAQTVTHGIVSAKGRSQIASPEISYQDFIQTDAAINPGNSGGPLLNLRGEVVGVNTAIATAGDGINAGIAFTIPSNMAAKIAAQLRAKGAVTRGYLGVVAQPLTEADADIFGIKAARGVLVDLVRTDSPAARDGLCVEDVILAINGTPITGREQFRAVVADLHPNDRARLRIMRDGEEMKLTVRIGTQPENLTASTSDPTEDSRAVPRLGLRVRTWRPGGARSWLPRTYDATTRGVAVRSVERTDLDAQDFQPDDLVVGCNGAPVRSVHDLNQVLKDVPATAPVRLELLEPSGDRRIVTIPPRTKP